MNAKQWGFGAIGGGIVLFVLGYVIWDILFAGFFAANTGSATGVERESQLLWAVALGSLSQAALITYALGSRGTALTLLNGLKVGAIVGFLLWFTADFTLYGINDVSNLTATIADPLLELVRSGITGAILGAVLPKLAA